jgi:hypothetical protein
VHATCRRTLCMSQCEPCRPACIALACNVFIRGALAPIHNAAKLTNTDTSASAGSGSGLPGDSSSVGVSSAVGDSVGPCRKASSSIRRKVSSSTPNPDRRQVLGGLICSLGKAPSWNAASRCKATSCFGGRHSLEEASLETLRPSGPAAPIRFDPILYFIQNIFPSWDVHRHSKKFATVHETVPAPSLAVVDTLHTRCISHDSGACLSRQKLCSHRCIFAVSPLLESDCLLVSYGSVTRSTKTALAPLQQN